MPNHCQNYLRIYDGEEKGLEAVLSAISGEREIDFNRVFPYPENFRVLDEKAEKYDEECKSGNITKGESRPVDGYNSGGFEWCRTNWGTKWNAYNIEIVHKDEYEVVIKFNTAWSPPHPVILKIAELFREYTFNHEFYERGAGYCGSAYYEGGVLKKSVTSDYYGFRGG